MQYNTSDLCDFYAGLVDVVDPIFCNYGVLSSFAGKVVTLKCFENLGLITQLVALDGSGKVLVIDGAAQQDAHSLMKKLPKRPQIMVGKVLFVTAVSVMLMHWKQ